MTASLYDDEVGVDGKRSTNMSHVRGMNTQPELIVRRLVHSLGYRYRLHRRDLPGTPDIVFPGRRKIIFVHGCFWHRHSGCRRASVPKTRQDFWSAKFARNIERDAASERALRNAGWEVLVVWECETRTTERLKAALAAFLD